MADQEPKSEPSPEFKALQRELEKSRQRNRELMAQVLDQTETAAAIKRLDMAVPKVLEAISKSGGLDDTEELPELLKKLDTERSTEVQTRGVRKEVTDLLASADTDWSDPRLADARKAWESGDTARTPELIRKAIASPATDAADLEALIEAAVAKRVGKPRVDTNDGAGGGAIPTDKTRLQELIKDDAWWKQHKAEVMQKVRLGEFR